MKVAKQELTIDKRADIFTVLAVDVLLGKKESDENLSGLAVIALNNINKRLTGISDDGESVVNLLLKISVFFARNPELFDDFMSDLKSIDKEIKSVDLISEFIANKIAEVPEKYQGFVKEYIGENPTLHKELKKKDDNNIFANIENRLQNEPLIVKANSDTRKLKNEQE